MTNNNNQKNASLDKALREIDLIFSATVKKLGKLHLKKMELIKYYRETGRQKEIEKIRKSLKNI
jgi:hypothetical protein